MFGILVGTLCFMGAFAVLRGGRGRFGRHGFGARAVLRRIFEELDTSPGQEKEIRAALEEFRERAWAAKSDAKDARASVVDAFRRPDLDEAELRGIRDRVGTGVSSVGDAATDFLKRVHTALDDAQRQRLADLLARRFHGPFGVGIGGPRGPYRGAWGGPQASL
ncbi:MAG: periplasmic heavy metal sensor [Polyangiaceae bacterium]